MSILNEIKKYNSIFYHDNHNVKLKLMASHPFIFLRGTVELFFKELAKEEYQNSIFFNNDLQCWCSNDIHATNFGFSNVSCSSNGEVHYQINDFDEAFSSNPFYDVIRFCSSLYYFVEEANIELEIKNPNHFNNLEPIDFINLFLKEYKKTIQNHKRYSKMLEEEFPFMYSKQIEVLNKSLSSDKNSRFYKYTEKNNFGYVLNNKNKKMETIPLQDRLSLINKIQTLYPDCEILDLKKRKVAGVGSSHLLRYYFILKKEEDYLLMELKEQVRPVSTLYIPKDMNKFNQKDKYKNFAYIQSKAINKMIGSKYDTNLKHIEIFNKSFISRTSFNAKLKVSIQEIINEDFTSSKSNLEEYIKLAAIKIGKVHVRSAKNKDIFKEEVSTLLEKNTDILLGMIKRVYNKIEMSYSAFLREYYLTIGNILDPQEFEEYFEKTLQLFEEQSSKLKKDISSEKNLKD